MRKKNCTCCKNRFDADTLIALPAGKFHSYNCASDYGKAKSEKARAKAKKQKEAKAKEDHKKLKRKVNINDTRKQHKLTQPRFNRMRVLQELEWFRVRSLEPT